MQFLDDFYATLVRFHPFFTGASCALGAVAALLFLRFYRKTSDRLFLFFSAAFALMSAMRVAFEVTNSPNEAQPALYLVRLAAFCLIIYAIIDKNRAAKIGRKN